MIEFKVKQQMESNNLSSEHIENDVLTLTYETSPSEYWFESKLQDNFDKYDQRFEHSEE